MSGKKLPIYISHGILYEPLILVHFSSQEYIYNGQHICSQQFHNTGRKFRSSSDTSILQKFDLTKHLMSSDKKILYHFCTSIITEVREKCILYNNNNNNSYLA